MLQSYSEDAGSRKGSGDKALKMESSELSSVKQLPPDLRVYQGFRNFAPLRQDLWPC